MGFEDFLQRKIDRERPRRQPEAEPMPVDQAYERAHKVLNNPDYSLQAPSFIDLYGKENVMADMYKVKARQAEFAKTDTPELLEQKKASDVFEAIVMEQSELSNWLGEKVSVMKTSIYDDYFNGTDMVAEWSQEGKESNVLGLAVDVTYSKMAIDKKLSRIQRDIDKGKLGTIKYFKTSDNTFRGERGGIPHVVIGVSKYSIQEIAQLWNKRDMKALAEHPIQRAIVIEMRSQLKTIYEYANRKGQAAVAEAYGRALATVEKIYEEKTSMELGALENDKVFNEIMDKTKEIFGDHQHSGVSSRAA